MIRSIRTHLGALTRGPAASIALFAVAMFVFFQLAGGGGADAPHELDVRILMALRNPDDLSDPLGPRWFEDVVRDVTALGGTAVLAMASLAVCGFLLLTGKRRAAWAVAGAVIGAFILSHALKLGFDRPRPDLVPHGVRVYTRSFPSAHAMMSAAVYLTLAGLLARTQARARAKAFVFAVAVMLTALTGASRVYLGVHWPSDVAAGWAAGAAWAILCGSVLSALRHPEAPG